MLTNLQLLRPLAVIDLETTGTDPQHDRIVEISVLRLKPGDAPVHRTRRINPGRPIPPEATAIHGITDADVADAPRFEQIARDLLAFLDGCDLCGFNIKKFDLRLLYVEFARAGFTLSLEGRAIIDPQEIYHANERRDLSAAVRFYCGRDHNGAHAAEADVLATLAVLDAQLGHYRELPRTTDALHVLFCEANAVDIAARFVRVDGQLRFNFGKHRGKSLEEVAQAEPDYLAWILTQDFFEDAKTLVRQVLSAVPRSVPVEAPVPMADPAQLSSAVCDS
jgi:DNA polymerase III subunit epsilon